MSTDSLFLALQYSWSKIFLCKGKVAKFLLGFERSEKIPRHSPKYLHAYTKFEKNWSKIRGGKKIDVITLPPKEMFLCPILQLRGKKSRIRLKIIIYWCLNSPLKNCILRSKGKLPYLSYYSLYIGINILHG